MRCGARAVAAALWALSMCMPAAARLERDADTAAPKLGLARAVLLAGDGPSQFKTTTLLAVLAGSAANVELAKLTKQYGAAVVKRVIVANDFVVAGSRPGRTPRTANCSLPRCIGPAGTARRAALTSITCSTNSSRGRCASASCAISTPTPAPAPPRHIVSRSAR